MPWLPYNPNPYQNSTTDCTVRAVCAVTGLPWRVVHRVLCEVSGELGEMPDRDRSWWTFLRAIGFRQYHLINQCPPCYTVRDFAMDHPKGRYILGPHEHAVAVVDGWYMDSWDSGSTVPTYYFEEDIDHGMESAELFSDGVSALPNDAAAADGAADAAAGTGTGD